MSSPNLSRIDGDKRRILACELVPLSQLYDRDLRVCASSFLQVLDEAMSGQRMYEHRLGSATSSTGGGGQGKTDGLDGDREIEDFFTVAERSSDRDFGWDLIGLEDGVHDETYAGIQCLDDGGCLSDERRGRKLYTPGRRRVHVRLFRHSPVDGDVLEEAGATCTQELRALAYDLGGVHGHQADAITDASNPFAHGSRYCIPNTENENTERG